MGKIKGFKRTSKIIKKNPLISLAVFGLLILAMFLIANQFDIIKEKEVEVASQQTGTLLTENYLGSRIYAYNFEIDGSTKHIEIESCFEPRFWIAYDNGIRGVTILSDRDIGNEFDILTLKFSDGYICYLFREVD